MRTFRVWAIWIGMTAAILVRAEWQAHDREGAFTVRTIEENWHDATRQREVPVKIYYPTELTHAAPVILFSHGLGGTRDGYSYLGTFWASHGYVSVHLQHLGSDDSVWRDSSQPLRAMRQVASQWQPAYQRIVDVRFAIDTLTLLNGAEDHALAGRLDLERIGMAGHSFGSHTTLAIAGLQSKLPGRQGLSLSDARVRAAIAMSAPVSRKAEEDRREEYAAIRIPVMHMTGTHDVSPINSTTAAERRIPFDLSVNAERYLITLTGGDHMVFSGPERSRLGAARPDMAHLDLIRRASLAFWDAYLRGDDDAVRWLHAGGLVTSAGDAALCEHEAGARQP